MAHEVCRANRSRKFLVKKRKKYWKYPAGDLRIRKLFGCPPNNQQSATCAQSSSAPRCEALWRFGVRYSVPARHVVESEAWAV